MADRYRDGDGCLAALARTVTRHATRSIGPRAGYTTAAFVAVDGEPWGVYGGYFGAAQGIVLMAILTWIYDTRVQYSNAAKNSPRVRRQRGGGGGVCLLWLRGVALPPWFSWSVPPPGDTSVAAGRGACRRSCFVGWSSRSGVVATTVLVLG